MLKDNKTAGKTAIRRSEPKEKTFRADVLIGNKAKSDPESGAMTAEFIFSRQQSKGYLSHYSLLIASGEACNLCEEDGDCSRESVLYRIDLTYTEIKRLINTLKQMIV